jgi:ribosome-associated translation inhibitor RaiA
MQGSTPATPPEAQGRTRGLFPRRTATPAAPGDTPRETFRGSIELLLDERLEDGMRAIEEQAAALMREIASEMWRASAADARPEQERIISLLSRDQAIRSLIASSDERFQSLAVRTASLEDSLAETAESSRAMRASLADSARVVHEAANSPMLQGVEAVRAQLEEVDRRIADTMSFLDERERSLVDGIQQQILAHGDLITQETTRIVEAMQGYVQGGVEAVGQLAQRVDAQIQTIGGLDETAIERVREAVRAEIEETFAGQLDQVFERIGMQGREMSQTAVGLREALEQRIHGLAQLVRSDSEAIRDLIERMGAGQETTVRSAIDDGLAGMAAQTREAMLEHGSATQERMERVEHLVGERVEAISDELASAVDREMAMLSDRIEAKIAVVAEAVALRAAEAADTAVASNFDRTLERMERSIDAVERMEVGGAGLDVSERLEQHVDDRLTSLAKMIRSDNRILAERMSAAPEAPAGNAGESTKLVLRAVKEMQATLAGDVVGSMDHRFQSMADQLHKETQSTAEAMVKVAEVMGQKIDRLSVRIDEGYGNDIQVVIDRMGDAIQAMSGRVRREEPFDL